MLNLLSFSLNDQSDLSLQSICGIIDTCSIFYTEYENQKTNRNEREFIENILAKHLFWNSNQIIKFWIIHCENRIQQKIKHLKNGINNSNTISSIDNKLLNKQYQIENVPNTNSIMEKNIFNNHQLYSENIQNVELKSNNLLQSPHHQSNSVLFQTQNSHLLNLQQSPKTISNSSSSAHSPNQFSGNVNIKSFSNVNSSSNDDTVSRSNVISTSNFSINVSESVVEWLLESIQLMLEFHTNLSTIKSLINIVFNKYLLTEKQKQTVNHFYEQMKIVKLQSK